MTVTFSNPSLDKGETSALLSINFSVINNGDEYFNVPGMPAICVVAYEGVDVDDSGEIYIAAYACDYSNFGGLDPNIFPPATWHVNQNGVGSFTKNITGLQAGKLYNFWAIVSFLDAAIYKYAWMADKIYTLPMTSISTSSAVMQGLVNPYEGDELFVGMQFWRTDSPGSAEMVWLNNPQPVVFREPLTEIQFFSCMAYNLKPNTGYYCKAVAYAPPNYWFGETLMFITLVEVKVFGENSGTRYVYANQSLDEIAVFVTGKVLIDHEGKFMYKAN